MKNKQKSVVVALMAMVLAGCKNDDMTKVITINYPAAYVVNGESSNISIINLNTDKVTATIKLNDQAMPGHGGMDMGILIQIFVY